MQLEEAVVILYDLPHSATRNKIEKHGAKATTMEQFPWDWDKYVDGKITRQDDEDAATSLAQN
jgi:hypothetical protein